MAIYKNDNGTWYQKNKLLANGGNYMELSIQIKKYRTELQLSQEELHKAVEVGKRPYQNILKVIISVGVAAIICFLIGVLMCLFLNLRIL